MAPLCADPRQIVITLDPTQRQALLKLVYQTCNYMISQWQTPIEELGSIDPESEGSLDPPDSAISGDVEKLPMKLSGGGISKRAESVQRAALKYALEWRDELISKLEEIVSVKDSSKILAERRKREELLQEAMGQRDDEMDRKDKDKEEEEEEEEEEDDDDIATLRALYTPISTELTTISQKDREEALSCILVLLLSTGKYSGHSRILILHLASSLSLSQSFINNEEAEIANSLMESTSGNGNGNGQETMSADAETEKRRQENKTSRFWKVGLASVAGAAVIGVTGGLAAPLVAGAIGGVMGGIGLGGVASFLGIFWMNGALIGTLFGAYGAKMTGEMMDKYAKEVEDFRFLPINNQSEDAPANQEDSKKQQQQQRRLRVTIGVSGWLTTEDDVTSPWTVIGPDTEVFALRYEMDAMMAYGKALHDFIQSMAWKALKTEIIHRTVLTALWAALWPIQVLSVASNVDNPFNRASNRSSKAGTLLADALINRVQGERPVTLIGYSLGATAIHACLQSLAERHAFGLIDTVVLLGTPAPSDAAHWRAIRPVVSGRIFNVYSENDMVLGFVYRVHSLEYGVAGLQAIERVEGIRNVDLSDRVSGHLRYASLTGEILRRCGFDGVRAGDDIEKDEVIQLQEQHAKEQQQDEEEEEDLLVFDESTPLSKPPLPPRPPLEPEAPALNTPQSIPRRPVPSSNQDTPLNNTPAIPRRPLPTPTTPKESEQHTAEPNDSEGHSQEDGRITMIDPEGDQGNQNDEADNSKERQDMAEALVLAHRILGYDE